MTYFNGDYGLSLRHPASWRTQAAEQDGVYYRYFLGPPGADNKPLASATLLVGRPGTPLGDYARTYLAGGNVSATRDEERQGARGQSYSFAAADGTMRYELLLVEEKGRVFGLYLQAAAPAHDRYAPLLGEIRQSFTLERPAHYPEQHNRDLGYALRVPASWRETRHFTGGGNAVVQFTSPPLAADKSRETVHASLSLTVEKLDAGEALDEYYRRSRLNLGDSFQILEHRAWRSGYLDVMRTETPLSESQLKRYYRVAGPRGYSLTLEARDDVFPRVARWYDLIVPTLRVGDDLAKP